MNSMKIKYSNYIISLVFLNYSLSLGMKDGIASNIHLNETQKNHSSYTPFKKNNAPSLRSLAAYSVAKRLVNNPKLMESDSYLAKINSIPAELKQFVMLLYKNRLDLNQTLIQAIQDKYNLSYVYDLLSLGADANISFIEQENNEQHNKTLLYKVTEDGRIALASLLLEFKANPNALSFDERTPLNAALDNEDKDLVQMLLDYKASSDDVDYKSNTYLMLAAMKGTLEVVKVLLEKGALINAHNDKGYTALDYALKNNHKHVAQFLIENGARGDKKSLLLALNAKNSFWVKTLLKNGANANTLYKLPYGRDTTITLSALCIAVSKGDKSSVKKLVKEDAYLNYSDPHFGKRPLSISIDDNFVEIAQFLLRKGADIHFTSKGITPIMKVKSLEMLELLLANGAEVDAGSEFLILKKIFETLCNKFKVLNVGNKFERKRFQDGLTSSSYQRELKNQGEKALNLLSRKNKFSFNQLVKNENLIFELVRLDCAPLVELMLEKGLDPNQKNRFNDTPLMQAYSPAVIKILLNHGANFDVKNIFDQSVLMQIIKNIGLKKVSKDTQKNILELLKINFLINNDALEARDEAGHTALYFAKLHNLKPFVKLLSQEKELN